MEKRIRLLITGDIHGVISPYNYSTDEEADCGLAKLSTLISALRDNNTLLIDNGDAISGSPLAFYHHLYHGEKVNPVTEVMKKIGYDYVNVGNHDFDHGEDAFRLHLESVGAPCITSNIRTHGSTLGPTYVIREIGGKKIAIFGLTTRSTTYLAKSSNIKHYRFVDELETAKKTVSLLKDLEAPDYIICVYHGGFERDLTNGYPVGDNDDRGYAILKDVPGIDILVTGHTHISMMGKAFGKVYTQVEDKGTELACIDIYTDTNVIEPQLYKADMEADPEILELVEKEENECREWLDRQLAVTHMDLTIDDGFEARLHKSPAVTLTNTIFAEAMHSDLSACALRNGAKGYPQTITMRSLLSTFSEQDTLLVKKINGAILKDYLEKCAEFWSIRNDTVIISPYYTSPSLRLNRYDMVDGVEYTIKVGNDYGDRITELTYHGEPVSDEQEFTICLTHLQVLGSGMESLRTAPTVSSSDQSLPEIAAAYFLKHPEISFEPVLTITVIK